MKRKRLAIIGLLLPAFILIASAGNMFAPIVKQEAISDPFAAMYDADELLLERLEMIFNTLPEMPLDDNNEDIFKKKLAPKQKETEQDTLLELVREGRSEEIEETEDLSEELAAKASVEREQVYENNYIVKYRNSHDRGRIGDIVKSIAVDERMEIITLTEKMNPVRYAQQLKEEGLDKYIEYIQPDIKLYPAGLSLELVEEDKPEPSGEPEEPAVDEEEEEFPEPEIPEEQEALEDIPDEEESDDMPQPSGDVIVALIDTGVDVSHPMLEGRLWEHPETGANGWNFYNNSNELYDDAYPLQYAHGTHAAGVIAETGGEYVKIMVLAVFGPDGAYTSDIIEALEYARDNGASIANMSFGSGMYNPALEEAVEDANMLMVTAAGNGRSDLEAAPVYPASFRTGNLISVGSVNDDGGLSYFSNYSSAFLDITAPGRDIESAIPGGETGPMTGTSMSAAHVSGGAAAVLSVNPELTSAELRGRMLDGADRLSNLDGFVYDGRRFNLEDVMLGVTDKGITVNKPEDDFNTLGYEPEPEELFKLFAASKSIKVTAGSHFSLALKSDGTVWAWGTNEFAQLGDGTTAQRNAPIRVIGLNNVVDISAGAFHNIALRSDGTVWTWGYNTSGQLGDGSTMQKGSPVQVNGLTNIIAVSAGGYHSLALDSNGLVWAWGDNYRGQLGNGTANGSLSPVQVSIPSDILQISAGEFHNFAVRNDGTVYAWGDNLNWQLGDGTNVQRRIPVRLNELSEISDISTGYYHSLALKNDGTVWSWGNNSHGQLGDGTTVSRYTPTVISALSGIVEVSTGSYHSLALKIDGTVLAWGYNSGDLLGDGTQNSSLLPVHTRISEAVSGISAGNRHSLALGGDGEIWVWGANYYGNLGDGTTINRLLPIKIGSPGIDIGQQKNDVSAGNANRLTLRKDGTVWEWTQGEPTQISELSDIVEISAGYSHSIAVKSDGTVWAWGTNASGELGDGTTAGKTMPVQVSGLYDIVKVAAGTSFSLALKSDGTVWSWGSNTNGQLGNGTTLNQTTPTQVAGLFWVADIAAGDRHSIAMKSDGTVWAWGNNSSGQLGDGTRLNNKLTPVQTSLLNDVRAITAGYSFSLALKSDGTVWGWGSNTFGELGDGTSMNQRLTPVQSLLSDVIRISAGGFHSLAVTSDGAVWGSGYNYYGQLGDGTNASKATPVQASGLSGIVSVSGGYNSSLAVSEEGTVWEWGQIGSSSSSLNTPKLLSLPATGSLTMNISSGGNYLISINAEHESSFTGKVYTVQYDPAKLRLQDFSAQAGAMSVSTGQVTGTPLTIVSHSEGVIVFTSSLEIPNGMLWSGAVTFLRFEALQSGETSIEIVGR